MPWKTLCILAETADHSLTHHNSMPVFITDFKQSSCCRQPPCKKTAAQPLLPELTSLFREGHPGFSFPSRCFKVLFENTVQLSQLRAKSRPFIIRGPARTIWRVYFLSREEVARS